MYAYTCISLFRENVGMTVDLSEETMGRRERKRD
jgi:hypothetical protein